MAFTVEASPFVGVTKTSSQTEENSHCTKSFEENPEDVDIICSRKQREIRDINAHGVVLFVLMDMLLKSFYVVIKRSHN